MTRNPTHSWLSGCSAFENPLAVFIKDKYVHIL